MHEGTRCPERVVFWTRNVRSEIGQRVDRPYHGGAGQVARRDLERYYALIRRELATVQLSRPEASLICDALNGSMIDAASLPLLWAEVADAIRYNSLDQKWLGRGTGGRVAAERLIERLKRLCHGQLTALADAVERFWLNPNEPDQLRRVGLVWTEKTEESTEEGEEP